MRFTSELRQKIIKEYASRHGGEWNANGFWDEVKDTGPTHPAYEYFNWDKDDSWNQHNLWLARTFAHGLTVKFEIVEVGRKGPITVTRTAPMVISPMAGRASGGGYVLTDDGNPDHLAEMSLQAANALRSWLARYSVCLPAAKLSGETFERAAKALESVGPAKAA